MRELTSRVEAVARDVDDIRNDEAAAAARRGRLEALLEDSRALSLDIDERIRQSRALNDALELALAAKDELLTGLTAAEHRQREVVAQADRSEDHVKRIESLYSALEGRREHIVASERKLASIEAQLLQLSERSDGLDHTMAALADREDTVLAVKAEVETIHQISQKSRADLQFVSENRDELSAVRQRLDALLATAADADDKIAAIESRRTTIDAVHAKTNLIANLLEDVRVNLETLGEQKAVIDHVAVKLARLDFMMQEAQNTLRALQHERELAERIEQNIAQLRARTALGPESKGIGTT